MSSILKDLIKISKRVKSLWFHKNSNFMEFPLLIGIMSILCKSKYLNDFKSINKGIKIKFINAITGHKQWFLSEKLF